MLLRLVVVLLCKNINMDIKIEKIADKIIVRPVKRLGRTNVYEFDYGIPDYLFLEPLSDANLQLNKLVYISTAAIPFWGYVCEIDILLSFPHSDKERRHRIYPGLWYVQKTLKVLKRSVNILPNKFTTDRDIWNFEV